MTAKHKLKLVMHIATLSIVFVTPLNVQANAVFYPGIQAPYSINNGDTLTVLSGIMENINALNYTVSLGVSSSLVIDAGATVIYGGSDALGKAVNSNRSASDPFSAETITNYGTINAGTGVFAIYASDSNAASINTLTINNYGSIIGSVLTSAPDRVTLNLNGANATITGGLTLTTKPNGTGSFLNIGNFLTTNYTTDGSLNDINLIHVFNGSTFTLTNTAGNIQAITVDNGGSMNIMNLITGASTNDGAITNNGALYVGANIDKTGAFITNSGGVTNITEPVTIETSSFVVNSGGTANFILTDADNIGNATFSTAIPNIAGTVSTSYDGGYIPSGTYILATSNAPMTVNAFAAPITPTLFIFFGPPQFANNQQNIVVTLTRTPYQHYATSTYTQAIGADLEYIGSNNPTSDMLAILDAMERSQSGAQVEHYLEQLAPLTTAPLFGFEVQEEAMKQVELRIASIRSPSYLAGDLGHDYTFWLRPFGFMANQRHKGDLKGYYATSGGIAFGLDRNLDDKYILGIAGTYALSHVKDKINPNSTTLIKSYLGMLYGTYNFDPTKHMDWVIGVAANNYDAIRYINLNLLQLVAKSTYSNQEVAAKAIWSKDFAYSDFLQITPEFSAQYAFAKQYEYTEAGGAGANLQVARENYNIVELGLGGKVTAPLQLDRSICVPEFHAMALYNIIDSKQNSIFEFIEGGSPVTTNIALPRTGARIGAAVSFLVKDNIELKINYDFEVWDRYTSNAFFLNLKYTI